MDRPKPGFVTFCEGEHDLSSSRVFAAQPLCNSNKKQQADTAAAGGNSEMLQKSPNLTELVL